MASKYFFDIPVYRLREDDYYRAREDYVDSTVFMTGTRDEAWFRAAEKKDPSRNVIFRDHLSRGYGGIWKFNEIIGYIRLYFLGGQVRGEYYETKKKRIVKTRTKILEQTTHKLAPEIDLEYPPTNAAILESIRQYLRDCAKEIPRRFIDTEGFDAIAPHVNWVQLLKES